MKLFAGWLMKKSWKKAASKKIKYGNTLWFTSCLIMDKKKVLILSYSNLVSDPRVQRQIAALMPDFKIEVCATGESGIKGIPFYQIYEAPPFSLTRKLKRIFWLFTGQFESFYWDDYKKEIVKKYMNQQVDAIVANDINTLPLALAIKEKTKAHVYFDAHEYHPREWASLMWKFMYQPFIGYLCKTYIPKVNSFSTVSDAIANEYDIGVFLLPPVNFNYQHALPNKIFEFVQARLAIVTTPNPEMKNLINTYNLGKTSMDYRPKSMAEAIMEVAGKIPYFKSQADKHARELSAENNYRLIRELVS